MYEQGCGYLGPWEHLVLFTFKVIWLLSLFFDPEEAQCSEIRLVRTPLQRNSFLLFLLRFSPSSKVAGGFCICLYMTVSCNLWDETVVKQQVGLITVMNVPFRLNEISDTSVHLRIRVKMAPVDNLPVVSFRSVFLPNDTPRPGRRPQTWGQLVFDFNDHLLSPSGWAACAPRRSHQSADYSWRCQVSRFTFFISWRNL